jgi:hypothetical protein
MTTGNGSSALTFESINQVIAANLLLQANNDALRINYAKAMFMSCKLWYENDDVSRSLRRPCSPNLIKQETGFNNKTQAQYKILIGKTEAAIFLGAMGMVFAVSTFKKKYTKAIATEKLDRGVVGIASESHGEPTNKTLYCTFAEWLYLEDFKYEPTLPPELLALIPSDWQCPDPETLIQ